MSFVEFTGTARLDRRTKRLIRRLGPSDVAIIDHEDIDRVSAEELLDSGVRVVVNVARSQTGRFPNPGPLLLVRGGVRLIDAPGAPLFDELSDGEDVSVRGASVFRNGSCLANGRTLGAEELARALAEQQSRVTEALEGFAENTLRYLRDEGRLLTEGIEFPPLETRFRDRHALVVARGPGYKRDLAIVRPYVRDFKPVLVGVDGGADALLAAGIKPDVIVGDMDSVSDGALRCGAELVVHAYRDGAAPGAPRLEGLGLLRVDLIGVASVFADDGGRWLDALPPGDAQDVRLRVALNHAERASAERLAREVTALYTCGPAGGGGVRTSLRQRLSTVPCLIARDAVPARFDFIA